MKISIDVHAIRLAKLATARAMETTILRPAVRMGMPSGPSCSCKRPK